MLRRTLIVVVAVLAVTGGTATAARLITGKDIQNGSLTAADIKNRSLGIGELSNQARRSLRGRTGAPGARGEAGPAGANGTDGAPGPPGISGHQRVLDTFTAPANDEFTTGEAVCPAGKKVLGGGFYAVTGDLRIYHSLPSADGSRWQVTVSNPTGSSQPFHAYAICAAVAP